MGAPLNSSYSSRSSLRLCCRTMPLPLLIAPPYSPSIFLSAPWWVHTSQLLIEPGLLKFSKGTKLKEVGFQGVRLNVQWITTLRTAESANLSKITITIIPCGALPNTDWETIHREWRDLRHLWTPHSIFPKIPFEENGPGNNSRGFVLRSLPMLASKVCMARKLEQ